MQVKEKRVERALGNPGLEHFSGGELVLPSLTDETAANHAKTTSSLSAPRAPGRKQRGHSTSHFQWLGATALGLRSTTE